MPETIIFSHAEVEQLGPRLWRHPGTGELRKYVDEGAVYDRLADIPEETYPVDVNKGVVSVVMGMANTGKIWFTKGVLHLKPESGRPAPEATVLLARLLKLSYQA